MADAVTNYTAVSTDALSYWIEQKMIALAQRDMLLTGRSATKFMLAERMGKTVRINRFPRLTNPRATLVEGTPPDATALTVENVDMTVEQWGIVGLLTDVADVTTRHPVLSILIDRTSRAINETREREVAEMLLAGTNVFYATGVATRAALTGAMYMTTTDILKLTSLLRSNGAGGFDGRMYIGCLPPQLESEIMGDTTFANAASYSQVVRLNTDEIGTWGGVRWSVSNFLPIFYGAATPGSQTASTSGYSNETGAGGAIGGAKVVVIAKDIQSGYERKISQEKSVTAGKDTADVLTPTSTNYVYDIYQSNTSGAVYKLVFSNVAANTTKTITGTTYTNGTTQTPTGAPADTKEVFIAWVFGQDGYGIVDLSGMTMQSYITPPGASWSNPIAQGRKVGNKFMAKWSILDNAFFARLESNSHYSANLPA